MQRHSCAGQPGLGYGYGDGRYGGVPLGSDSCDRELVYCTVGLTPEAMYTYQLRADILEAHPGTLVASLAGLEVRRRQVLPVLNCAAHCAAAPSSCGAHVLAHACTSGPAFAAGARACASATRGETRGLSRLAARRGGPAGHVDVPPLP